MSDYALLTIVIALAVAALAVLSRALRSAAPVDGRVFRVVGAVSKASAQPFFDALHGLAPSRWRLRTHGRPWVGLEVGGEDGRAFLYVWIPTGQEEFVTALLRGTYPGVELVALDEDPVDVAAGHQAVSVVVPAASTYLPLRTKFDGESLGLLFATLARTRAGERIHVSLLVRPRPHGWQSAARRFAAARRTSRPGVVHDIVFGPAKATPATPHDLELAKAADAKAGELGFDCVLRVWACAADDVQVREYLRAVAAALRPFSAANSFAFRRARREGHHLERLRARRFRPPSFLLTSPELAALWHLPSVPTPDVVTLRSPKLAPPTSAPTIGRVLGIANYPGRRRPVAQAWSDARRHTSVTAPTGAGKTWLAANLILQQLEAGHGVGVIDAKGDLIELIKARLPAKRLPHTVLFSPTEREYSIGINPLAWTDAAERDLVAENLLAILKANYAAAWGPRTDDVFKACLIVLLARPDSVLCEIPLLLSDPAFRARVLADFDDPVGLSEFWAWFESLSPAQRNEVIGAPLNKLRDLLVRPRIRRLLCQRRATVDLRTLMDNRGVFLANLAAGALGEGASSLLGSFLLSRFWQAARSRASVPEEDRVDFSLYVDEFQSFVVGASSMAETLAQARSFRLSLTLLHQHVSQIPKETRDAISANCRTKIVMQCGQEDARYFAHEFEPLDAAALMNLPRYTMAVRLSVDGETSAPFTLDAQPLPPVTDPSRAAAVDAVSRQRYARPNAEVDAELRHVLFGDEPPEDPPGRVGRRPRP